METRIATVFVVVFCAACVSLRFSDAKPITMKMYHRYSEPVMAALGSERLPEHESAEYHRALVGRDARRLEQQFGSLSPMSSNVTAQIESIGYLQFTVVQVGTPNFTIFMALDTASSLLWVPCDCTKCSPYPVTNSSDRDSLIQTYSPSLSTTSRYIACDDKSCYQQSMCTPGSNRCPYSVAYTTNGSSSGDIVEDRVYLVTNGVTPERIVQTTATFGCGKMETGDLIEQSGPFGVLGLGQGAISLPSILSRSGLVHNSFSMCLSLKTLFGRFALGEIGSPKMKSIEYFANESQSGYIVGIEKLYLGNATISTEFHAILDTAASYTYLPSPIYKSFIAHYRQLNNDQKMDKDEQNIFELCYHIRNNQSLEQFQVIVLNFIGGNNLSVLRPIIPLHEKGDDPYGYCLGVLENPSSEMSIIGQNFMTGYNFIFNRDRQRISWEEDDCFDIEFKNSSQPSYTPSSSTSSGNSSNTSPLTPQSSGALSRGYFTKRIFNSEHIIYLFINLLCGLILF